MSKHVLKTILGVALTTGVIAAVDFDFGTAPIARPGLAATGEAFERHITTTPLPEPAVWAMSVIGAGMTGAIIRHRRGAIVVSA